MSGARDRLGSGAPGGDDDGRLDGVAGPRPPQSPPGLLSQLPTLGSFAWSFVGVVVAVTIVVLALGAVSEIMLPMTFAAVLAVIFKPMVVKLQRRGLRPTLAAVLVLLGLLALLIGIGVAAARGVIAQADQMSALTDEAVEAAAVPAEAVGVGETALDEGRTAIEALVPLIKAGVVAGLVSGIGTLVAVAGGLILGALIMYYLLKDGTRLRRSFVAQFDPAYQKDVDGFIGDACLTIRDYGRGRTIMSAIVSAVVGLTAMLLGLPLVFTIILVNFVGGYIPYIGAFIGGGLAVIIALGDSGLAAAVIMLVVVLAANLALENFVEPKVMGMTLHIHPLVVLVVTALGGLLGGIVGLILAVPTYVIAGYAVRRLRSRGVVDMIAKRAEPAVHQILEGGSPATPSTGEQEPQRRHLR